MVWTPYDFYVGDTLSHCGADAFVLVREDDRRVTGRPGRAGNHPNANSTPTGHRPDRRSGARSLSVGM